MKKKIVNFETAKKLKELGFDGVCDYLYTDDGSLVLREYKNSDDGIFPDLGTTQSYAAPYETETNVAAGINSEWLAEKYKSLYTNLFTKLYELCKYLGVKTADTNEVDEIAEKCDEMIQNIKNQYESPQPLDNFLDDLVKNETDRGSIIWRLVSIIKDLQNKDKL